MLVPAAGTGAESSSPGKAVGVSRKRKKQPARTRKAVSSKKTSKKASISPKLGSRSGRKTKSVSAARRKRSKRASTASWKRTQQTPTPERYKEIQQALIDRGYLEGPPTGEWGPTSVDALKRFQQDQKLDPTGKLDALTLIGLGLGPKRDLAAKNSQLTVLTPHKDEP